MREKYLFVVLILLAFANSINNPGMLITVPFPLSPPSLTLKLPQPINDTVISNL